MANELVGTIPLADMLEALRIELLAATRRSKGALQLDVEKIEIELQVQMESATKAEGGVRFWVLMAGADHTATSSSTHTLKLQMKPSYGGEPLRVSDETGGRPE